MKRRAFSMVELVIVVVIAGIIAAIAVPRVTGYTARARGQRVVADMGTLQKAAELFSIEHGGLALLDQVGGGQVTEDRLISRLTLTTDDSGTLDPGGIFGPYLRSFPENVLNGLKTVRIDGAPAGAGTHGWRFDSALGIFQGDVTFSITLPDGSTTDNLGGAVQSAPDIGIGG